MDFKTLAAGLLLLVVAATMASANSLDFKSPSYQTACKCDPLTFKAQLNADEAESYSLSVSTQLSAFVTPSLSASAGSQNAVDVIITSPCSTQAGNYSFVISAKGSKGNDLQLGGVVGVRECSQLKLTTPASGVLCGGDQAQFVITLENKGVFTEEGTLSTDLPSSYYSLSDTKFKLEPGKGKQFVLIVSVPQNAPPATIPFKVVAASPYSYREAFSTLSIGGAQCSSLRITLPQYVDAQVNQETQVQAQFANIGGDDSFTPSLSCSVPFSFATTAFSLASGASTSRAIAFKPVQGNVNKDFPCTLTGRSTRFGTQFTATTIVRARQLYSASLQSISGASIEACKGEAKSVSLKISNTGKASSFTLSASAGSLSQLQISVGENASADFTLSVDASEVVGEKLVTIAASNNVGVTASSQVNVKVRECYGAGVKSDVQKITLCPSQKNSTTITISNTGDRDDSYSYSATSQLQVQLSKPSALIKAGASDSVLLVVSAPDNAGYSKDYSIVFQAKGKTTASSTIAVKTLEEDYCRNLVLSIAPQLPAHQIASSVKNGRVECEECGSETFEIELKNEGAFDEELTLSVQGAAWAFLNPSSIILAKGEKKSVFVYLAPPAGTSTGTYDLNFTARGTRGVFASSKLEVVVLAAGTQPSGQAPSPVATAEVSFPTTPAATETASASPEASRLSGLFTAGNTISALIIAILGGLVALWLLLGRDKLGAGGATKAAKESKDESVEEEESEKKGKKEAKKKK